MAHQWPTGGSQNPKVQHVPPLTQPKMVHRWFTEPGSPARAAADAAVNGRFAETLARAERGELDHWLETPEGALALILVLDQFSRHVRRGEPPQGGGRAEEISRMVMGRGVGLKAGPRGQGVCGDAATACRDGRVYFDGASQGQAMDCDLQGGGEGRGGKV